MKRLFILVLLAAGCASAPPETPVASAPVEVSSAPVPAASAPAPKAEESPRVEIPKTIAGRDPFVSPLGRPAPAPEAASRTVPESDEPRILHRPEPPVQKPLPDLELTGILLSPGGNRALVREEGGTHVVGVGDRLDGFRVVAIDAARITLSDGTRKVDLHLPAARES